MLVVKQYIKQVLIVNNQIIYSVYLQLYHNKGISVLMRHSNATNKKSIFISIVS